MADRGCVKSDMWSSFQWLRPLFLRLSLFFSIAAAFVSPTVGTPRTPLRRRVTKLWLLSQFWWAQICGNIVILRLSVPFIAHVVHNTGNVVISLLFLIGTGCIWTFSQRDGFSSFLFVVLTITRCKRHLNVFLTAPRFFVRICIFWNADILILTKKTPFGTIFIQVSLCIFCGCTLRWRKTFSRVFWIGTF